MRSLLIAGWSLALLAALPSYGHSLKPDNGAAVRPVYLDKSGVVRWRDSNEEVALYGANYCLMSGSDYRMAGLLGQDRKAMIDEDMAQFARMGWTALRLCSWGDWENSDRAGNLVHNEHVDLMDYLIAKARERGIYILLTPIHTYDPAYADQLNRPSTNTGFSRYFDRSAMGTNPTSIAAQANYIRQLLNHLNPYTHITLKDEPAILFIEMINEPVHHPEDLQGSVNYINTLVKAVRDTGCKKITFFNVSQDFAIAPAIKASHVDGVTFGWYPTGLVAGHEQHGNFLQAVDAYPDMLRPELKGRPRIVYEFDQADLLSGTVYPAMARTFRSVGAQSATMFAYDMLQTAPYNLGWQTHFLNLVHTPKKAVSAVIAAEAMRRLPRMQSYGKYPDSDTFGDFRVSYQADRSELNAADAFMNAGDTSTSPRNPASLERIVGFGSSPLVNYEGTGAYFMDKVREGVWRLEVYPDQVMVRDPFEQPQPGQVVSRLLFRSWPITLHLPDLGNDYYATPVKLSTQTVAAIATTTLPTATPTATATAATTSPTSPPTLAPPSATQHAAAAQFIVQPGVWLISKHAQIDKSSLPARIDRVGFAEYHVNSPVAYADDIQTLSPAEYPAEGPVAIRVRVADTTLPDHVNLWIRPAGMNYLGKPIAMTRSRGNDYVAVLPAKSLAPGLYEYVVSASTGERVTTYPGSEPQQPGEWPFHANRLWSFKLTASGTALRLLDPKKDYPRLSFVRVGEQYRTPFFHLAPGENDDEAALELALPDLGKDTPERYAAALYVGDTLAALKPELSDAKSLTIRLRAVEGQRKTVQVTLVETDGAAWTTAVVADGSWTTRSIPLESLVSSRSILIPTPYPGLWDYWREVPAHRGGPGDHVRPEQIERLQLTVTPNSAGNSVDAGSDAKLVAVESIYLSFH